MPWRGADVGRGHRSSTLPEPIRRRFQAGRQKDLGVWNGSAPMHRSLFGAHGIASVPPGMAQAHSTISGQGRREAGCHPGEGQRDALSAADRARSLNEALRLPILRIHLRRGVGQAGRRHCTGYQVGRCARNLGVSGLRQPEIGVRDGRDLKADACPSRIFRKRVQTSRGLMALRRRRHCPRSLHSRRRILTLHSLRPTGGEAGRAGRLALTVKRIVRVRTRGRPSP